MKIYTQLEVKAATLKYFGGDELATNSWIDKYALRNLDGQFIELTPDDMHKRMAVEFARISYLYTLGTDIPNGPLDDDPVWKAYYKKYYDAMSYFQYIVPQGSPMYGIGNNFAISSLGNCFVIDNQYDSYGGILNADQELVQLMKRRGGVGIDMSSLRPHKTNVSNAARTSTGVPTFMERYSNSTREVAQDGRRGALMESIHISHPDSPGFIDKKSDLTKVTGANVSVKVSDEFMDAVIRDVEFTLQFPVGSSNPTITKQIKAKEIWNKIIHNAWKNAEPGLLFWDTIIKESPADCYPDFQTISTNPCVIGSTLIATADGRNAVTIKQLTDEGHDVPVYSTDPLTGQIQIKYARNPRLTGTKRTVWKLTLDDGSSIIATPDHQIMLSNKSYCELKNLKPGDSLMPLYTFENNGYRQITKTGAKMIGGNHRNRRQYRLIHEFHHGIVDAKITAIHHSNFNSKDDHIENLLAMPRPDHVKLHADRMRGELNPYHKFTIEQKHNFASHPGTTNGRYISVTNTALVNTGKQLFTTHGKLTKRVWCDYAKQHGLPQHLSNEFRFGSFLNFKNQVAENHKVVSVEFYGYDDVYNITVDDNHNYNIITSYGDSDYIVSSGITVKNCGEIPLCPYDSCRLLSLNLYGMVDFPFTSKASFNWARFDEMTRIAMEMMDNMIDLEQEKINKIIDKIANDPEPNSIKAVELNLWRKIKQKLMDGRRTGLGVTGEGDMLAALGMRYASNEARFHQELVHKQFALSAYSASIILASQRGSFPAWDYNLECNNPFIRRILGNLEDQSIIEMYKSTGRRNIALLTLAPTGTTSIMTQTTSGIEPVFAVFHKRKRKIVIAQEMKLDILANPASFAPNLTIDAQGDVWEEYVICHPKFETWYEIHHPDGNALSNMPFDDLAELVVQSPYYLAAAHEIDYKNKITMQGEIQRWIDHSISVTHNLPAKITEAEVSELYIAAWQAGCKGMTVYREGSRDGILTIPVKETTGRNGNHIHLNPAPKRPKVMTCDIHHVTALKEQWIVLIGLLNGDPYEIFAFKEGNIKISPKLTTGKLIKIKSGVYNLEISDAIEFKDICHFFERGEQEALTRMLSWGLRHGGGIQFACEQLNKSEDHIASFSKAIARALKKYIPEDAIPTSNVCPECQQETLVYEEGCLKCVNPACGWSKCG